jgi:uncharacterized protein (UPF0332 family)
VTNENRRTNIAVELAEAKRHRESAERNANEGDRETAANRLYFAALHAVKAVCLTKGLEPKTHRGLKQLVVTQFILAGELPEFIETALGQLETERDLADYSAGYRVTAERYEERRDSCDRLLESIDAYLRNGGWLANGSSE